MTDAWMIAVSLLGAHERLQREWNYQEASTARGVMSSGVEVVQRNNTSPVMRGSAIILEYPIDPMHREFPGTRWREQKDLYASVKAFSFASNLILRQRERDFLNFPLEFYIRILTP